MNKLAYRLVRNHRHGLLQAVPETARAHGAGQPGGGASTASRAISLHLRTVLKPIASALSAGLLVLGAQATFAADYVVINGNDSGAGSLRQTIVDANLDPGSNIILSGSFTANLLAPLPTLTASTTLVYDNAVTLAGGSLDAGSSNLTLTGTGTLSAGNATGNQSPASLISGGSFSLDNDTTLSGGQGGVGATGNSSSTYSVPGGTGGTGPSGGSAISGAGFSLTNSGAIYGGTGGTGGNGGNGLYDSVLYTYASSGNGGTGGTGGAAISGSGFLLTNTGAIAGGAGGAGGQGGYGYHGPGSSGSGGAGGAGILSTGNATIINAGTISGGLNAGSLTHANAISLSGGGNEVVIHSGAVFNGNVVSTSGTTNGGDTLTLGGDTNGSFALSSIGSGAQFQGFANYSKTGDSTWTLTGTTSQVTNWTIEQGALSIAANAALGAAGSVLTLDGGTLLSTAAFDNTHDVELGSNGGTLSNNASGNSVFTGVISGGGDLTISGSGTTVLTGSNTYTGTTTIDSGSNAQVGEGGTTGSLGSGNVSNNGSLVFNRSDLQTVANQISGSGSLTVSGTGTTVLTANNTYTGTTTIDSGSNAQVGEGGTTGSLGSGNVINNGSLVFNRSNTQTVANQISGAGSLMTSGSGATVLTGNNSYTGTTLIASGSSLQIGNGGTTGSLGSGNVINGGSLVFDRSNTYTVANQISGSGSLTVAGGTLTLSAANTYTGATTIDSSAGLNLADGASLAGAVSVSSGATLAAGDSSVAGNLNNAGSVAVAAGKTLSVGGNFTSSGDITLEVASMSSYAQIDVTGTANLGGALYIDAASAAGLTSGSLASVIHADGGINGSFTSVSTNSQLFSFSADYGLKDIGLLVTGSSSNGVLESAQAFGNRAGYGAARALDRVIADAPTSELAMLFIPLTSQQEVSNAVSQSMPLLLGGNTAVAQDTLGAINRQLQARLDDVRGQSSGDAVPGEKHFWAKPFGTWTDQDTRQAVSGYDAETYGISLGVDGELNSALRLGLAFTYAKSDIDAKGSARQRADIDLYQLSAYGSYNLSEATAIDFHAGIGRNRNEGRRTIAFASSVAKADFDSDTAYAGIGIGHRFALGPRTSLTPSIRADYSWIRDESYTEKGAGALNLDVDSRSSEALVIGLDGKLAHELNAQSSLIASLGVGYDTLNQRSSITAAFAGAPGAAFRSEGIKQEPWLVRGGIGTIYKAAGGLEITGRYDAEYREDFLNQTASVKLNWAF